ncbi:Uncharacterised protein [Cedecea neteri]|uniref:Uncharacterized protein n=1 Tax=Cedecea neteri TaxID=158822 RepID=A0A2X3IJP9_9ENTR|nr:Uncharacterised protein [Cedecea neteri]
MTLHRLAELLSNSHGRLSSTEVATVTALVVSSLAVLACVVLNRQPGYGAGVVSRAWVTHAGVQGHQRLKSQTPPPDGGNQNAR